MLIVPLNVFSILGGMRWIMYRCYTLIVRAAEQSPQRLLLIPWDAFVCMGSTVLIKAISALGFWCLDTTCRSFYNAVVSLNSKIPFCLHIFWFAWYTFVGVARCHRKNQLLRVHFLTRCLFPDLRWVAGPFWVLISFVCKTGTRICPSQAFTRTEMMNVGRALRNSACWMLISSPCLPTSQLTAWPFSAKRHKIELPEVYLWSEVFPLPL